MEKTYSLISKAKFGKAFMQTSDLFPDFIMKVKLADMCISLCISREYEGNSRFSAEEFPNFDRLWRRQWVPKHCAHNCMLDSCSRHLQAHPSHYINMFYYGEPLLRKLISPTWGMCKLEFVFDWNWPKLNSFYKFYCRYHLQRKSHENSIILNKILGRTGG